MLFSFDRIQKEAKSPAHKDIRARVSELKKAVMGKAD